MFKKSIDERLSEWVVLRESINFAEDPLQLVWDFWKNSPFIPYNKNVDPYNKKNWPSPWDIIVENRYDDFTKSLMIAWTLKLTKKFLNSHIEIKIMIDNIRNKQYNLVFIDNLWILNQNDDGPISINDLNDTLILENIIEIDIPR